MELVLLFCFGVYVGDVGLDFELFVMFMSYVIEGSFFKIKDFLFFLEYGIDVIFVVRLFLL